MSAENSFKLFNALLFCWTNNNTGLSQAWWRKILKRRIWCKLCEFERFLFFSAMTSRKANDSGFFFFCRVMHLKALQVRDPWIKKTIFPRLKNLLSQTSPFNALSVWGHRGCVWWRREVHANQDSNPKCCGALLVFNLENVSYICVFVGKIIPSVFKYY